MATIGSIAIAFEANLSNLESGVEDVLDLFDDITESLDDLNEKLDGVSDKKIKIKAEADTKAVKSAKKEVEDLETTVSKSSPVVKVSADTSALAGLGGQFVNELTAQVGKYGETVKEFGSAAGASIKSIASAATAAGDVLDGTSTSLSGIVVAASRAQKAFSDWEGVTTAAAAATGTFLTFAGGARTVMAAFGGSVAASVRVVASLGAASAVAVAGVAAYSGIMAVARLATAGLSEEARAAVLGWTSLATASTVAAVSVASGNAAFAAIYDSLTRSSTAAEFFGSVMGKAGATTASAASSIAANLGRVVTSFSLIAVASGKYQKSLDAMGGQAESIRNMAERFGTTADQIQVLSFAAESAGVSMGQLAKAQQAFYMNVGKVKIGQLNTESIKEAKFSFDRLGISVEDLRNQRPEEVFRLVAERLDRVQDASDRAAIAFDLFGKQGANILPALRGLKDAAADAARLGTVTNSIDFSMFENVDQSFDRLRQASGNLAQTMLVSFAPLQTGWNNLMADLQGGLVAALGPIKTLMAAATAPLQVFMEVTGRLLNVLLRAVGVVLKFFTAMSNASALLPAWNALGDVIKAFIGSIEQVLSYAEAVASAFTDVMTPALDKSASTFDKLAFAAKTFAAVIVSAGVASAVMQSFGIAAGAALAKFAAGLMAVNFAAVFGGIIKFLRLITIDVVATAVRWVSSMTLMGVTAIANFVTPYIGAVAAIVTGNATIATSATVTGYAMAAAWVIGTLGLAAVAVAIVAVIQNFDKLYDFFADFGNNIGRLFTFEGLADAASAIVEAIKNAFLSVFNFVTGIFGNIIQGIIKRLNGIKTPEKIAAAQSSAGDVVASRRGQQQAQAQANIAAATAVGASTEGLGAPIEDIESLSAGVQTARDDMVGLSMEAARFGEAGRKAFLAARADFDKLQQQLADNTLETEVVVDGDGVKRQETALEAFERKSQEIRNRLRENLNLADVISPEQLQQSAEEMRKTVEGAFAQTRASMRGQDLGSDLTESKFFPTSDEVKKQAEEFALAYQDELMRIEKALQSGEFGQGRSAMRAAQQAREQAKQTFDQNAGKIEADISFASEIRKALEDAFLSPLQKYEKRLEQIQNNKSLTAQEKSLATVAEQKQMVESTFGKSAGQSLREREALFASATAEDQYGRTAFMSSEGTRAGGQARASAERTKLDIETRKAAGLDATAAQQLKAGADNIADVFGVTGLSLEEVQKKLSPEQFAEYQEAIKKNSDAVKASIGVEQTGAQKFAESRARLDKALSDGVITQKERDKAVQQQRDSLLSSLGIDKSPAQDFQDAVDRIKENASALNPDEIAKGLKAAKDRLLESLGIPKSPAQAAADSLKNLGEAFRRGQISADELAKGTVQAKNALLQSLGIPLDPVVQLGQRMNDLREAFSRGQITTEEFARGQEEARRAMLPGSEDESPVKAFQRDMDAINRAAQEGLIGQDEANQRRQVLRADLQENLKPALENLQQDRRQVGASDVRSRGGVDTFFRILQGRDNPSLKAQLEIARNTRILAEAQNVPDAVDVIAQLAAR